MTSLSCSFIFLYNIVFPSGASVRKPILIVVFESLSHPQSKKKDLTIIRSPLERVQICRRCWKTEESAGFFLSSNYPEQTKDPWTTITKQKTHTHTVLKIIGTVCKHLQGVVFVLWTILYVNHQSKISQDSTKYKVTFEQIPRV